ncbi:unnamed protein product, partial [Discosporangium mesarthrocarpum]
MYTEERKKKGGLGVQGGIVEDGELHAPPRWEGCKQGSDGEHTMGATTKLSEQAQSPPAPLPPHTHTSHKGDQEEDEPQKYRARGLSQATWLSTSPACCSSARRGKEIGLGVGAGAGGCECCGRRGLSQPPDRP